MDRSDNDIEHYGQQAFRQGSTRWRVRQVAEDAALAIAATDQYLLLLSSTTGTKAATFATEAPSEDGQLVAIALASRSGGSYTVATDEGTITLDTGGDYLVMQYSLADDAWHRLLYYDAANGTVGSGAVGTTELADGAVTPVKLSSGYRTVAEDAALTLAATDRTILLVSTTTGAKAATMTATHGGHRVDVRLVAATGGSYTLAVTGGDVTLDAAGDGAAVVYSGAAWELVHLHGGATLV